MIGGVTHMKKKSFIISGVLVAVIALGIGMYTSNASQVEPTLNHDEVKSLITSQYPGKITELELEKDNNKAVYEIEIVNDDMEYELKVDANSGQILKLKEKQIAGNDSKNDSQSNESEKITLNEKNEENENKDANNGAQTKVESQEPKNEKQENKLAVLDPSQAIEIALAEFPGVVEDVELDEEDGRLIYEIEIENGDEEAEFEIDAMTGE